MVDETLAASGPRLLDAFGLTADPSAYVPRLATEAALAELAEVVGKTSACAALSGEAGLGKTLLLHVLRERLQGAFECLYVPFPRLAAPELWRWVAVALGLGTSEDDRAAVLDRARRLHADGKGLALLIDDAGALPPSTRTDLLGAIDSPGLSLVLAFNSEDHPQLGALPAHVRRVELGPPMTLSETRAYLHARLRRADPRSALAARLTASRLASLQEASGGVPARLHALLDAWLRSSEVAESGPEQGQSRRAPPDAAPVATASAVEFPRLPEGLSVWLERARSPRVRLVLISLFLIATVGAWLFALRRGPPVPSVGVPLPQFESPREEPAPSASSSPEPSVESAPPEAPATTPADSGESTPPAAEPAPAEESKPISAPAQDPAPGSLAVETPSPPSARAPSTPTPPAKVAPPPRVTSGAPAPASRGRALAPPLPKTPPVPNPNQPEPPVHVSQARFPDEHVPPLLEPEPLAPPPPGPRLSVNARPWAEISVDGKPVGETPLGELSITAGAHTLSAKLPDGRVVERTVEARAGDLYVVFP